jgi:hypothetical protein
MEKHLDNLAATVHKLLPAKPGEQAVPATQASWAPQPTAQSIPSRVSGTAARSATNTETARASSTKAIWIALGTVGVLAAVILAVVLGRGGGNPPQPAANLPNPPSAVTPPPNVPAPKPATDSMPVADLVKKRLDEAAKLLENEPIVGCYQWFNNAPVVIHADGTMVGGPFTGHWRLMTASATIRTYTFTWPPATDTVTISPDQQSLSGANQYGFPASGTRMAGTFGLIGAWRWPNGVPVTVMPNGTFTAATFQGRWQATDAVRGIYTLTWPSPVDSVTLSADGSHISGANQYGVAISGVRTEPCSEN